jgi:hypothetical protein
MKLSGASPEDKQSRSDAHQPSPYKQSHCVRCHNSSRQPFWPTTSPPAANGVCKTSTRNTTHAATLVPVGSFTGEIAVSDRGGRHPGRTLRTALKQQMAACNNSPSKPIK